MAGEFKVVVLLSGSGSNLQALLDDQHGYQVTAVVADRADAYGLQRGLTAHLTTICLPLRQPKVPPTRTAWEQTLATIITSLHPDLLVLAGWMRIMSPWFIAQFQDQIINQHPALLPDDKSDTVLLEDGTVIPAVRGAHAVRDALRLSLPVTGCTVHRVTDVVDVGPVLGRRIVPILPNDDEIRLHERIKQAERQLIVQVVRHLTMQGR